MRLGRRNTIFLQFISTCSNEQRLAVLKTLDKKQIKILVEIIFNIGQSVIPITTKQKNKFTQSRRIIRQLLQPNVEVKARRNKLLKLSDLIPSFIQIFFKYDQGHDTFTTTEV